MVLSSLEENEQNESVNFKDTEGIHSFVMDIWYVNKKKTMYVQ